MCSESSFHGLPIVVRIIYPSASGAQAPQTSSSKTGDTADTWANLVLFLVSYKSLCLHPIAPNHEAADQRVLFFFWVCKFDRKHVSEPELSRPLNYHKNCYTVVLNVLQIFQILHSNRKQPQAGFQVMTNLSIIGFSSPTRIAPSRMTRRKSKQTNKPTTILLRPPLSRILSSYTGHN